MIKVKGQRSRSQCKVIYQQQKRYTKRFNDFKLGSVVIKSEKDWRGSSCNAFAVAKFYSSYNSFGFLPSVLSC